MRAVVLLAVISAWLGLCAACGSEFTSGGARDGGGDSRSEEDASRPDLPGNGSTDSPTMLAPMEMPDQTSMAPKGCGDGTRTADEACDDGNKTGGDGCSADCLGIEPGFACTPAGKPCRVIARCGDGIVASSEECDDANSGDGDGCSARCKLEAGTRCDGEPSTCSKTTCGDGKQEGSESCDDGNKVPFDGCSATCQAEPNCRDGACSSRCGDALVLNEACDDGNSKDGDGCSARCEVESGFMCTASSTTESRGAGNTLRVPAIFRDFAESHPDFGIGCDGLVRGIVQDQLNADGKPVLANAENACIQSAETFAEWYTSNANNATIVGEITLFDNGKGGYVNRYGPNGEQWSGPRIFTNVVYGGPAGAGCSMCQPSGAGQCFDPCTPWNDNNQSCCGESSQQVYDGSPLFFPLDDSPDALTDMRYRAKLPEQYGHNGWPFEDTVNPGAGTHDFHFTTEVVYWFEYKSDTNAVLDFTGDDDVWVFVNRRLAVDLGGVHVPENGTVTIDAASASRFGLTPNNVYEVRVLHAERKIEGSSFRLTLSGFDTSRSDCRPTCGDGIVTLGEECDDGVNDGGYEECAPGCVLGARCGDNQVQDDEDCDDGNRRDGDACGSSCRKLMLL